MKAKREHWGSHFGFLMAAAGSAIGLGSLWRFPYIAGDSGGGAFVLLYALFTFILGVPLFIGELIIGRKAEQSSVLAYEKLSPKKWRMVGYLNMLTSFIVLSFYSVVAGWCLSYTLTSLTQSAAGRTPQEIEALFETLYTSPGLNLFWLFIFILLNVGILYSGIRKGIEYWSRILTPSLFFILITLLLYGMTLPGFGQAARFIFYPNFSKLTPAVILNALGMAFFTLSIGLGIVVTYGSYLKPTENIPRTAWTVASMTLIVSLMAAMMIFPIVFTFHLSPEEGPGLVFKTMPLLFSKLPGSLILSTLFFLLFVFTALTSSISLFEVLVANLMELLSWKRSKAVLSAAVGVFLFAIPSASLSFFPHWKKVYGETFFDTMNTITANWMIPLSALLTTLFIGIMMKKETLPQEFPQGKFLFTLWFFIIRYVSPFVIILVILKEIRLFHH